MAQNPSRQQVEDWARQVTTAFGIPYRVLLSVMDTESDFQQFNQSGHVLTSSHGNVGLMQVMPTSPWGHDLDVVHSWRDNLVAGARQLAFDYHQTGDWHGALAGYGAGLAGARAGGGQDYARGVLEQARQKYGWGGDPGNPNPNASVERQPRGAPMPYRDPFRGVQNLRPFRIDQGVDYGGSGPIYALGPGVVVRVDAHSGWLGGGYIAYRLTSGPATGKVVYVAENIALNPHLHIGSSVTAGTQLATLHEGYPHLETGWATQDGMQPLAKVTGGYTEGQLTAAGQDFSNLMKAVGAPGGLSEGRQIVGHLPSSWPSWGQLAHDITPNIRASAEAQLGGILRGFGLSPGAFTDLIDRAVRDQWGPAQFEAALYGSKQFHQMFPGIFRDDGSLRMTPSQWLGMSDQYRKLAQGTGVGLNAKRIGILIAGETSPDEWAWRLRTLQAAKQSDGFRQNYNAERRAAGLQPIDRGEWFRVVNKTAASQEYDFYEATRLRQILGTSPRGALKVARQFNEPGTQATESDLRQLGQQVKQYEGFIQPELRANGISRADVALIAGGQDPRGLAPVLQQLLRNRQALAGAIPRATTTGASQTVGLFPSRRGGL